MRPHPSILAIVFITLSAPFAVNAYDSSDNVPSVQVNATGTADLRPDFAQVEVEFSISKPKLAEARDALYDSIYKLSQAMNKLGIENDRIDALSVGIEPVYADDNRRITGYLAHKRTRITIRDITKIGLVANSVLEVSGAIGNISDVSFGVDDPRQFESQARDAAMKHANEKAAQLARLASAKLGQPLSISESVGTPIGQVSKEVLFAHIRRGGAAPSINNLKVTVAVSVSYSLL